MQGPFQQGNTNPYIKLIQRALNETTQSHLVRDGNMGPGTVAALKAWQTAHRFTPDGVYANDTAQTLDLYIASRFLTDADYTLAAVKIGCEVGAVVAVRSVETSGEGFLPTGRPTILFERHIFKRVFDKKLQSDSSFANWLHQVFNLPAAINTSVVEQIQEYLLNTYGDIYNPTPGGYSCPTDEYPRLNRAMTIDKDCARQACSWGLFQIMGWHYDVCGYATVQDMVAAYNQSEREQLMSFCNYVLKDPILTSALRNKNWAAFAREYNGAGYANFNPPYDIKLARAYQAYLSSGTTL